MNIMTPAEREALIARVEYFADGLNSPAHPDDVALGNDLRALIALATPIEPEITEEWRCFHCDEVFRSRECATEHFGKYQDCDPICKVGAERYRDLENQLAVFLTESDAASKEFYSLGAKHTVELRRAEEEGYAKGLRDAQSNPEITEAMVAWRPIDSAPKDRLLILSRWNTDYVPFTRMFWASHGEWSARWGRWWDRIEPSGLAGPTHWMSPPAPKAALQTQQGETM